MRILVTPTFERAVKKLHRQQKSTLGEAVRTIISQPEAGETKVGDLAGVQVDKFRMGNMPCLLAHRVLDEGGSAREFLPRPQTNRKLICCLSKIHFTAVAADDQLTKTTKVSTLKSRENSDSISLNICTSQTCKIALLVVSTLTCWIMRNSILSSLS